MVALTAFAGSVLLGTSVLAQDPGDEQHLRDIQQRLARAWLQRDRAFIEGVLAPEWSVTQGDGEILTRAAVLGPFFDGLKLDTFVVDEVTVLLFGTTAVVRGRTVAAGALAGKPVSARIRFTDVFIKRNGRWQAVASHASPLVDAASSKQAPRRTAEVARGTVGVSADSKTLIAKTLGMVENVLVPSIQEH